MLIKIKLNVDKKTKVCKVPVINYSDSSGTMVEYQEVEKEIYCIDDMEICDEYAKRWVKNFGVNYIGVECEVTYSDGVILIKPPNKNFSYGAFLELLFRINDEIKSYDIYKEMVIHA